MTEHSICTMKLNEAMHLRLNCRGLTLAIHVHIHAVVNEVLKRLTEWQNDVLQTRSVLQTISGLADYHLKAFGTSRTAQHITETRHQDNNIQHENSVK